MFIVHSDAAEIGAGSAWMSKLIAKLEFTSGIDAVNVDIKLLNETLKRQRTLMNFKWSQSVGEDASPSAGSVHGALITKHSPAMQDARPTHLGTRKVPGETMPFPLTA